MRSILTLAVCFVLIVAWAGCGTGTKSSITSEESSDSVEDANDIGECVPDYVLPEEEDFYKRFFNDEQKRFLAELAKIGVECSFDENEAANTAGVYDLVCCYQKTEKTNARPARLDRPFEHNLTERIPFDDALLEKTIRLFPNIASLGLVNSSVTDEGLEMLTKHPLPCFRYLDIGNTDPDYPEPVVITDRGIKAIGQRRVHVLNIFGCPLTDEDVAHLPDVPRLTLAGTKITAKAFRNFAKMRHMMDLKIFHNDFSATVDRETYEAIVSLNGRLTNLMFTNSGDVHPSFIRATSEIKSLIGYAWDLTDNTPIWDYDTPYKEISYEAILDALRRRHPDMDLTEWEKYREIEFGANGEVVPNANIK
jgi:hypothetical protein